MEIKRKGTGTKENIGCKDSDIKTPANASCIHGRGIVSAGIPNSTAVTAGFIELVLEHDFGCRLAPWLPSSVPDCFFTQFLRSLLHFYVRAISIQLTHFLW